MQGQVKKYLDDHTEKWNTIPAIVRMKNELDENLQAIKEKLKLTGEKTQPTTETKKSLKETVSLKAAILAGSVAAYAAEAGNNTLASIADWSENGLFKLGDQEFSTPVDTLIASATASLEALADQGVTEAQLTELQTSLDDFNELVGNPRKIQIREALRKKEISELIKSNMDLLNDRMDKSMLRYKLIDPIFYEGYERSRVIVG